MRENLTIIIKENEPRDEDCSVCEDVLWVE